jgi:hypothetical protein
MGVNPVKFESGFGIRIRIMLLGFGDYETKSRETPPCPSRQLYRKNEVCTVHYHYLGKYVYAAIVINGTGYRINNITDPTHAYRLLDYTMLPLPLIRMKRIKSRPRISFFK